MSSDDRVREALRTAAADMSPDTRAALEAVTAKAAARDARRRRAGIVAALVVAGLVGVVALLWRGSASVQPAVPSVTTPAVSLPAGKAPLAIERTISARSLGLERLLGVALAPDGTAYATDSSQRVVHLSLDGKVLQKWGSFGARPGQFSLAQGAIAVGADGKVYVADNGNARVEIFGPTGGFLAAYGQFGYESGRFVTVDDLAVDSGGSIYVTDGSAVNLTKLSPSGEQLWRIGQSLTGTDPHLAGSLHVSGSFDDQGRLVVVNDSNRLVVRVDGSGHDVSAIGPVSASATGAAPGTAEGDICDAAVDRDGLIYIGSCQDPQAPGGRTLAVADSSGRVLARWPNCPLTRAPVVGPDGVMVGITYDGNLVMLHRNF